jgi:hypothetical protein
MGLLRNLPRGYFYRDQYQRMLRWYERFRQIDEGRQPNADFEAQYDEVLAFFMNCDHLYDWIEIDFKVDKSHHNIQKYRRFLTDLKEFRNGDDMLKLCTDLSIGAKHLHSHRKSHFGEEIGGICREIHIDETGSNPSVKSKWKIKVHSGKEYDAFDIATHCITIWKKFLDDHQKQIRELMDRPEEGSQTGYIDESIPLQDSVVGSGRTVIVQVQKRAK